MGVTVEPATIECYRAILSAKQWQAAHAMPPAQIRAWLLHQGSLTQKLRQLCHCLTVQVVYEGWTTAKTSVKSTALCHPVWRREVLLQGDGNNWIFARTCLPQRTVENVAQDVIHLADQPIGPWLFAQRPQRLSLDWRCDGATGLYARRSEFLLAGYPLEIRELFLADFDFAHITD
ncbi:chorismate--pyruvate lyase family protein [Necropsobacter massiliensis]|uniref:chorismate--pyruvate lyase family protein n=1 Tax=Necropsobacter massiliensis TaxID=1400001 RepID=UPI000693DCF3|nr:chorismate lyase [Necropsobacter massiliensis]